MPESPGDGTRHRCNIVKFPPDAIARLAEIASMLGKSLVIPEGAGPVNPRVLALDLFLGRPPPACGRVEVGGGVRDRPEGDRVSGRRSLTPPPIGACLFKAEDQKSVGRLPGLWSDVWWVVVLLHCQVFPAEDRPRVGAVGHPFAVPRRLTTVAGMVRCDRGSRWVRSIRGGDHAEPACRRSGGHDQHDLHPPRGSWCWRSRRLRCCAGRQRMW